MVGTMYIYTCVGLSALLVSTYRAMRRPKTVERVTELAPRSLYMYANNNISINRRGGAIGKNDSYMKNLVTLRFMLISLFAAMSMVMNAKEYSTYDGFKYDLNTITKTAELMKYSGSATEVTIPKSITYEKVVYHVTSLGKYCFSHCDSLTSINIPSSVTSLGIYCFSYCSSLTSVNIPSSVTSIGKNCFEGCSSLPSIKIPSSVTSLGEACFGICSSLTSIIVDAENSVYDSRENCNAVIETESNTMICGCGSTVIPSSVTSLGDRCFISCTSLTSVNIPPSVTSLGEKCFAYSTLTSINIPPSVMSLGNSCFEFCVSLTSINFDTPSFVTSLGYKCFWHCSSLTSITIPSSVTSLGSNCFDSCSSLTSINIPSSVKSLGEVCFQSCSSLKTMKCEIPTPIKSSSAYFGFFYNTPIGQAKLYVPKGSLAAYRTTSPWSGFGTILPLESSGIESRTIGTVADVEAVYGLDGKRCEGMKSGMNIIRMSNGTTRKIVK